MRIIRLHLNRYGNERESRLSFLAESGWLAVTILGKQLKCTLILNQIHSSWVGLDRSTR